MKAETGAVLLSAMNRREPPEVGRGQEASCPRTFIFLFFIFLMLFLSAYILFIYVCMYGFVGSSFLCEGFL